MESGTKSAVKVVYKKDLISGVCQHQKNKKALDFKSLFNAGEHCKPKIETYTIM